MYNSHVSFTTLPPSAIVENTRTRAIITTNPETNPTNPLSILSALPSAGLLKRAKFARSKTRQIWIFILIVSLLYFVELIQLQFLEDIVSLLYQLEQLKDGKMPLPQLLIGKVAAITGGLTGIGRVCYVILISSLFLYL